MPGFVHLHVHSEYSLLDGACRIKELVKTAKELNQSAIAITDHGVMYGAIDFYKIAKQEGIKPIIGCEVYTAPNGRFSKSKAESEYNHLVLLVKNETGYKNLIKLVSFGFTEGFYIKPRIDEELLRRYSEGLIALSACLAGEIPRAILKDDYEKAKQIALKYFEIFGEGNFYLELQDHGIKEQEYLNPKLLKLSQETNIPVVATNDAHYIRKSDAKAQNVLLCIQTNKTVEEGSGFGFQTDEFYIKSSDEMKKLFKNVPQAIENTVKIAEQCNIDFDFNKLHLPSFDLPQNTDHFEYLKELSYKGFKSRYKNIDEALTNRLEYELEVIKSMGFVDYFLIVHDFIDYAKKNDIPVGPGRGSAAGCIVSYCLAITDIDPIKYDLLFERFLNPERISMPDIDIDFCYVNRQKIIDYVVNKYGKDRVVQIITFGTMQARAAIRDVGRALGMPYAEVDTVAKLIPFARDLNIGKALLIEPRLYVMYQDNIKIKELIDTAKALEGMPRHASTHAAGVVITSTPAYEFVPLQVNDEAVVTQYPMGVLEELGLLKMDFLGLRNLTVIHDAEKQIKKIDKNYPPKNMNDYDDLKTYELLSSGNTDGVFQLESSGMKQVLTALKPRSLEDITAIISLYRPGPMDSIPRYIECKNNPSKISYKHPLLKDILDVTYGCIVYQEQVMQIVRTLGGYSYGRADLVRRAMSKKKAEVMEKERQTFLYGKKNDDGTYEVVGAVNNGVDKNTANAIFDEMTKFAEYAFNKSHGAAYAVIAYKTAYLKCHYPKEYMAALLTSVLENSDKVVEYIAECERLRIKVLAPEINESGEGFVVSGENIRFGLVAVKNVGSGLVVSLIKEREKNGAFKSFYDFIERMYDKDINRRALESLIKCGAFDCFNVSRKSLMLSFDKILKDIIKTKKDNIEGQLSLFGGKDEFVKLEENFFDAPEYDAKEILAMEKETTGMYLTGHPMESYKESAKAAGAVLIRDILSSFDEESDGIYKDGDKVAIAGIIVSTTIKTTKNDSVMAFATIEDTSGSIEILIFPKILEKNSAYIKNDSVIKATGKISIKEEEKPKLICDTVTPLLRNENSDINYDENQNKSLNIKIKSMNSEDFSQTLKILEKYQGEDSVRFYFEDSNKFVKYNKAKVKIEKELIDKLSVVLGKNNVIVN